MVNVNCDLSLWGLEAIQAAAYDMESASSTRLVAVSDNILLVEIIPRDLASDSRKMADAFMAKVLDHQVRLNTLREYKVIREMIVAQAFEPCEDLAEIVKSIDL